MKYSKRTQLFAVTGLLVAALSVTGCNMTGGIDDPKGRDELVSDAKAKIDSGQCDEAVTILNTITDRDDNVKQLLGWAHLCTAGASVAKVGKTLLSYDSTAGNLTIVGNLANGLVPSSTAQENKIVAAITTFTSMSTSDDKAANLTLANIARAAAIIARSSGDQAKVVRGDIAPAASCLGQTCALNPVNCAGGMTDNDAAAVANALAAAANAAQTSPSLGSIGSLATSLNAVVNAAQGHITRCTIYNSMLTQ